MNNFSDDDPQLTNFLRQYRSIPPIDRSANIRLDPLELEERIMIEIDQLEIEQKLPGSSRWWRSLLTGIGIIATGILGINIHSIVNPPTPSMAELDRIDRYLVANWHDLDTNLKPIDPLDNLDVDLSQDEDAEDV